MQIYQIDDQSTNKWQFVEPGFTSPAHPFFSQRDHKKY